MPLRDEMGSVIVVVGGATEQREVDEKFTPVRFAGSGVMGSSLSHHSRSRRAPNHGDADKGFDEKAFHKPQ